MKCKILDYFTVHQNNAKCTIHCKTKFVSGLHLISIANMDPAPCFYYSILGWQPGIQETAATWDEEWDRFGDEGMPRILILPGSPLYLCFC